MGINDTKEIMSSTYNRTSADKNSQILWQETLGLYRFKTDPVPVWRTICGHGLPFLTKKLSVYDTHLQGKNLQSNLTGYINHTVG